jgi:hypothetical protein
VHIADASATVLARLGAPPVPAARGKALPVLHDIEPVRAAPQNTETSTRPERSAATLAAGDALAGERRVAERLRNLGYIE